MPRLGESPSSSSVVVLCMRECRRICAGDRSIRPAHRIGHGNVSSALIRDRENASSGFLGFRALFSPNAALCHGGSTAGGSSAGKSPRRVGSASVPRPLSGVPALRSIPRRKTRSGSRAGSICTGMGPAIRSTIRIRSGCALGTRTETPEQRSLSGQAASMVQRQSGWCSSQRWMGREASSREPRRESDTLGRCASFAARAGSRTTCRRLRTAHSTTR